MKNPESQHFKVYAYTSTYQHSYVYTGNYIRKYSNVLAVDDKLSDLYSHICMVQLYLNLTVACVLLVESFEKFHEKLMSCMRVHVSSSEI